jgi:hypothetical protein
MLLARLLAVLTSVSAPALVIFGSVIVSDRAPAPRPLYSLAALEAKLDRTPRAWVGRTVSVRAVVEPCSWWSRRTHLDDCTDRALLLVSRPPEPAAAPLSLTLPAQPRVVSALEGAPFVGAVLSRVLPPAPAPSWGVEATYMVRLQNADGGSCGTLHCCTALLLAALS